MRAKGELEGVACELFGATSCIGQSGCRGLRTKGAKGFKLGPSLH